jgi:hypothetical protein
MYNSGDMQSVRYASLQDLEVVTDWNHFVSAISFWQYQIHQEKFSLHGLWLNLSQF